MFYLITGTKYSDCRKLIKYIQSKKRKLEVSISHQRSYDEAIKLRVLLSEHTYMHTHEKE